MKRILLLLCLAFLCGTQAFAQSAVWKISNGDKTIYLAGSWHVLREADYPLPREFDLAFEKSDAVAFESDLDLFSVKALKALQRMYLPAGKTLKTELRPEIYESLIQKGSELGLTNELFLKFKPFMAVMMLEVKQLEQLGFVKLGIDDHYFSRARQAGKRRFALESLETGLVLFDDIDQNDVVESMLDDWDRLFQLDGYVDEWRQGKMTLLENYIEELKTQSPLIYERLLTQRNHAWLPKLERFLKTKKTEFVIVGFAHLVGNDGLLKLLRDKGYKVEQYLP